MMKYFNLIIGAIIIFAPIIIALFLGFSYNLKAGLVCYGIYSLLMLLNITLTGLANAYLHNNMDKDADAFWKLYFIFTTSICGGLLFI